MSRVDSRSNSIPPQQHSTAMSKADDSGSSTAPGGAPENSVAYQYVAVQQMTTNRDHIEYQLTVREQPKQSRMCGVGEKADRRPIDPAPIVQLRIITHDRPVRQNDTIDSASVAPPVERRPGHGPKVPSTPGVRRGLPVSTALGDGWEDKAWYLENPYFFMYAMLCNADTDEELHLLNDGKTRYTSGSCVSCLYHLKDIDGSHQGFFVFPDLSIRVEGRYRLKLCLFETIGHSVHHCKSIYSDPFHVYTAKRFPGMEESTKLSKSFAEQGLKVRVRKHPRSRRRSSKRTKDDSDASDDAPLARDRSPKRARASDILPASGLPMPQPLTSRMPRSVDARFERADYDRKPLTGASPHDLKGMPPSRHAAWEEEEAMRMRDARSRDGGFDQSLYARHIRDERMMERGPPARDFAEGRFVDDYQSRDCLGPVHPSSMAPRDLPDYPEYGRSAYLRDEPVARPLAPPRHAAATPPHSSHPSLAARGHPEPPAPLSRSFASAAAPIPSRPPRVHSRPYGPPDHPVDERGAGYDDYSAPPGRRPTYSTVSYDQREMGPTRRKPSPSPPSGSIEYGNRGAFAPPPPTSSQWRSGPPSPRRANEYHAASIDHEYPARRSPTSLRRIATPPAAFVGDSAPYHRRGYGSSEPRPPPVASAYDLEPGARHLSSMRPLIDPYARDELRPSDIPPPPSSADRYGHGMMPSRERPLLPPLSSSPSMAHREGAGAKSYPSAPRDRDPGYSGPNDRYLPASSAGYMGRGGPPLSDAELSAVKREREWERERMSMRGGPGGLPLPPPPPSLRGDEVYAPQQQREWEARNGPTSMSRPQNGGVSGGASRPY